MPTVTTLLTVFALTAVGACSSSRSDTRVAGATPPEEAGMTAKSLPAAVGTQPDASLPVAYFAGGCFWCTEASFERIAGVQSVVSGYSGGDETDPTYEQVGSGRTGHAEAIAIRYDPAVISYRRLLDVFFVAHDPTTLNRQGPDVGAQYRSAIFYQTPEELALARATVDSLNASGHFKSPIVTQLAPYTRFYDAEAYHQDYYELHPDQPYVRNVSRPKVEKVMKEFAAILKPEFRS